MLRQRSFTEEDQFAGLPVDNLLEVVIVAVIDETPSMLPVATLHVIFLTDLLLRDRPALTALSKFQR
jgi:hypothetical protein